MATVISPGGFYSHGDPQVFAMSSACATPVPIRGEHLPLLPHGKNPLPHTDTAVPSGHLWGRPQLTMTTGSHIHA